MPNAHPMRCGPQPRDRRAPQLAASPQLIGLAGAAPRTAGAVVERIRPAFAGRGGNFGLGPAGQHLGGQLGAGHGGQACVSMAHEGSPVADGLCSPQQFQRGPPPVNKLYVNYS